MDNFGTVNGVPKRWWGNTEPTDKKMIWYRNGKAYAYSDGAWNPITSGGGGQSTNIAKTIVDSIMNFYSKVMFPQELKDYVIPDNAVIGVKPAIEIGLGITSKLNNVCTPYYISKNNNSNSSYSDFCSLTTDDASVTNTYLNSIGIKNPNLYYSISDGYSSISYDTRQITGALLVIPSYGVFMNTSALITHAPNNDPKEYTAIDDGFYLCLCGTCDDDNTTVPLFIIDAIRKYNGMDDIDWSQVCPNNGVTYADICK